MSFHLVDVHGPPNCFFNALAIFYNIPWDKPSDGNINGEEFRIYLSRFENYIKEHYNYRIDDDFKNQFGNLTVEDYFRRLVFSNEWFDEKHLSIICELLVFLNAETENDYKHIAIFNTLDNSIQFHCNEYPSLGKNNNDKINYIKNNYKNFIFLYYQYQVHYKAIVYDKLLDDGIITNEHKYIREQKIIDLLDGSTSHAPQTSSSLVKEKGDEEEGSEEKGDEEEGSEEKGVDEEKGDEEEGSEYDFEDEDFDDEFDFEDDEFEYGSENDDDFEDEPNNHPSVSIKSFPFDPNSTKNKKKFGWVFKWDDIPNDHYYIWGANNENHYLNFWIDDQYNPDGKENHDGTNMASAKPDERYVGIITMAKNKTELDKFDKINKNIIDFLLKRKQRKPEKIYIHEHNGVIGIGTGEALKNANEYNHQAIWLNSTKNILNLFVDIDKKFGEETAKFPEWKNNELSTGNDATPMSVNEYIVKINEYLKEIELRNNVNDTEEKREEQEASEKTSKLFGMNQENEENDIQIEQEDILDNLGTKKGTDKLFKHLEKHGNLTKDVYNEQEKNEVADMIKELTFDNITEKLEHSKIRDEYVDNHQVQKRMNEVIFKKKKLASDYLNDKAKELKDKAKEKKGGMMISQLDLNWRLEALHILQPNATVYLEIYYNSLNDVKTGGGDAYLDILNNRLQRKERIKAKKEEDAKKKFKKLRQETIDMNDPAIVKAKFEKVFLPPNRIQEISIPDVNFFWIPDKYEWYEMRNRKKTVYTVWIEEANNDNTNDNTVTNPSNPSSKIPLKDVIVDSDTMIMWKVDISSTKIGGKSIKKKRRARDKTQRAVVHRGGAINFCDVLMSFKTKDNVNAQNYMRELGNAVHSVCKDKKNLVVVMRKPANTMKTYEYWSAARIVLGNQLKKTHPGSEVRIIATIKDRDILFSEYLRPIFDSVNKEGKESKLLTELREEENNARVRQMSYNERMKHFAGKVNEEQIESQVKMRMRRQEEMDKQTGGIGAFVMTGAVSSIFGIVIAFLFSPL